MPSAISDSIAFLRENDVKTILSRIRQRKVPSLIQFAVYGMCGGLATLVYLVVSVLFSYKVFPAMDGMIVDGAPITDALRAKNLLINNCIAFALANVVAYVTNILFVFETGRHHPVLEFIYFTAVSFVSFAISQIAGPWLVSHFGVSTKFALLSNVVASALLNFVFRKFFVFKN
ncbi:MAG: GtrA family protein [Verrucomicrobia bacterium]|nr:GtrA family protein [Verrucomicrobiota bacterium]